MSFNHPVSDLVCIIRNGYMAGKSSVSSPASKLRENILQILKEEGYIENYAKIKKDSHNRFEISLKYNYSKPVVSEVEVVSKPGRRAYCASEDIPLVKNGLGVVILSTSKGVIADHKARSEKIGGEILLKIF